MTSISSGPSANILTPATTLSGTTARSATPAQNPLPPSIILQPPSHFQFPPQYSFPPFFTLQPIASTRSSQLVSWSVYIQSYCRHHRLFSLTLIDALQTPLFYNDQLGRRLGLRDAQAVINWMCGSEGQFRAEWIASTTTGSTAAKLRKGNDDSNTNAVQAEGEGGKCWVFWRRPEEWASVLEEWVERTAQKGTVLTLYEIVESDATMREEFWGMDSELLTRCLAICVKRGKAQIFGGEGSEGVKFF
ncbi:ESCRT-II complex, vps25 subunit [Amniculicola lignicola CBS 123094]|uniref:Vacuolar protein-sorting-associated protein 25 n=1 Tax=Amniculicola lignicola CBS 123094 TaxID=1392246 RepID=A0A6A5W4T2_9PLEO|nr:ESCRT-II complex, vps25 subunit [Amniculicola lignicola CBS 123094]